MNSLVKAFIGAVLAMAVLMFLANYFIPHF